MQRILCHVYDNAFDFFFDFFFCENGFSLAIGTEHFHKGFFIASLCRWCFLHVCAVMKK